jgi:penicillin-binding protein 1C
MRDASPRRRRHRRRRGLRKLRRCAARGLTALLVLGAVVWVSVPAYRGDLSDFRNGTRIYDANGNLLRITLGTADELCYPIPLHQTGEWVVKALVAAEDKRFFSHPGIDPVAVARATLGNLAHGRVTSGASTLTTLVVKLTEPRPRTLWTKIVEARHAVVLDAKLSKEEILEQYLNRAPFGANIRGIEAAARYYFGKRAQALSLSEAALLVGLPQCPAYLRPDRYHARAMARRNYVLTRMRACGSISATRYREAMASTTPCMNQPMPFAAPHFCDWLLARHPDERVLNTTLSSDLQSLAEDVLRSHSTRLRQQGITGGAMVIVDVKTGDLRALVGSPDFFDRPAGQVNAAVSRRSPGSALKPFVYAMAIDQGLCTPETVVWDVPMSFANYEPRNYNLSYAGPVTVRRAMVQSLNIPAVAKVDEVGLHAFAARLRDLGLGTLDRPATTYGLSLVVGSGDVTLLDLANAYACFARLGEYRPLRVIQRARTPDPVRLFSPEAAYLVNDVLGGSERRYDACQHVADAVLPRVAWKTGTSAGHRDAWTIAYNPDYVVGVWFGNPDGGPHRALVGAEVAAPAAYEVFRRLYPDGLSPWYTRPAPLRTRTVCATSGRVMGRHCTESVSVDYIPCVSDVAPCSVHRGEGEVWPAHVAAFLRTRGRGVVADSQQRVRITSPTPGAVLSVLEGRHVRQELKLAAVGGERLHWFVDGTFVGSTRETPLFWPLARGHHLIACADDRGRSDRVTITVE